MDECWHNLHSRRDNWRNYVGILAGQTIESKPSRFHKRQFVEGLLGVTSFAVSDGKGLKILDLKKGTILQHLEILGMPDHRGYVSPNNIFGKLKFFVTRGIKPDLSEH